MVLGWHRDVQSRSGRDRIGPELIRLASSGRRELRTVVRPFLDRLSAEVAETVDLAVLIQDYVAVGPPKPQPRPATTTTSSASTSRTCANSTADDQP